MEIHVVFGVTFCQNLLSQTILKGTPKGTEPSIRITQVSVLQKLRLSEVLHVRGPREFSVKEEGFFLVLSRGKTVMYFTARFFFMRFVKKNTRRCLFDRPLSSSKNPHFRNEANCTLPFENEIYLHDNEKSFPYQRMSTYPRFDTEARGNSERPIHILVPCRV